MTGVPVEGYWHWSLVDNYEWGSYEPRFGLYGVDRHRGEHGSRWLETDALGTTPPAPTARIIAGLRPGDRSVLDPDRDRQPAAGRSPEPVAETPAPSDRRQPSAG